MAPLLSVIIPVHDSAPYLENCLNSIARQSLTDFEVILVDNGSTDDSGRICDTYCRKDARFTVIHQKHRGVSGARNSGLGCARGKYVGFVDSDDWVSEDHFLNLYNTIEQTGADVVIGAFYRYCSDTEIYHYENKPSDFSREVLIKEEITGPLHAAVWNQLYKTSYLQEHSIFFPKYDYAEDSFFCVSALWYTSKIAYCPFSSYYYRKTPNSLTNEMDPDRRTDLFLAFTNNYIDLFNKFDLWKYRPLLEAFYYRMNKEKLYVLKRGTNHRSKLVLSSTYPESYRYWTIDTTADYFYRSAIKHGSPFPLKLLHRLLKLKYSLNHAL
jgi:glycosyltransferase involved in cell wall biosynthesis